MPKRSRCSSVTIVTRLRSIWPRFISWQRPEIYLFASPSRPALGATLSGSGYSFPGIKAAGAWSWPLTSIKFRGWLCAGLYFHSPIRLHDVVLS